MKLTIAHATEYRYEQPVSYVVQRLRLRPMDGPTQKVLNWSVLVDGKPVETGYGDQYCNQVALMSLQGNTQAVRIVARGEVETIDTAGVYGAHQGFTPLWLFLRHTPRTKPGQRVHDLVQRIGGEDDISRMHALMNTINSEVTYLPGTTDSDTTAEQALEAKSGVCQDHAHIFIAAARSLGIPARYVSGYLLMDGVVEQVATHAWAEVHLPNLGWAGFDPANNVCPDERYVRIATGMCYHDCAPIAGVRIGPTNENLTVSVTVARAGSQQQ